VVAADGTLGRALDVLLALGDESATANGGLGVVGVATLLGREKSQVSRTLKTLAERGLVDRDPDTLEYRLGARIYALAVQAGRNRLLAVAPPALRELVTDLGETAHLSVLQGREVLTLLSESSPRVVRAGDWSGRTVPAHCTSSGRALLWDEDMDGLTATFGTARSGPQLEELHEHILAARPNGYAAVREEFEPGLVGAAAPVRDFRGRVVAALNVSGPSFRLGERLEETGGRVRRTAEELSGKLGRPQSSGGGPDV
jgi:IclR family transcriptional regulator, KDG regulon repressor